MDYEIKIFTELNQSLKNDWNSLELNSSNYCFQTYDWFDHWVNKYRKNNKENLLQVVVIKKNSRLQCILPFEIESKFKIKVLKWASNNQTDYCSPIISKDFDPSKETFINLFKKIIKEIKNFDIIYFTKQPEYINSIKNPFTNFLKNYEDSKIYYINLPKTWDDFTSITLKKDFHLQNLRKKKSLKKLGNLKYKVLINPDEKKKYLDELFIQKNIRLSSRNIKEAFKLIDFEFYKEFEKISLKNISTHVSSLELDNEIIAIHWGIIHKNRFYYLLLSMKEGKFKRFSPGRLLISLLIRWSISKKLKIFDFTLGEEDYKKSWSNSEFILYNYIYLNNIKGFFLFSLIKFKLFLKSFKYIKKISNKIRQTL